MPMIKEIIKAGWNFDNSYSKLPDSFFTRVNPTRVRMPKIVILNNSLASSLGLDVKVLQSEEAVAVLSGNKISEGSLPIAEAYAGHQFGYFTMLGDGRAVLLGEHVVSSGERFDIQLKGSGITPYSRGGDGRAALGPMLREYIISEAMNSLGIPTTRSLAVVTTGEYVFRETRQIGAILTRVASSHLRVGTFQYISKWGTKEELRILADYTLKRHFPYAYDSKNRYLSLIKEVIKLQAVLIAKWQLVGFIHGVMNTDNMTVSGETIDYGPCAFMDEYDPETVFSSIDIHGRYAYGNQPIIAKWNLKGFAKTLLVLLDDDSDKALKLVNDAISEFDGLYHKAWISGIRAKLGIFDEEPEDETLVQTLLDLMYKYNADYTNTFLSLTFQKFDDLPFYETEAFAKWQMLWQERLDRQKESIDSSIELMKRSNPALIPRNYIVEEALEAAVKYSDYSVIKDFLDALSCPYAHSAKQAKYSETPKKSCSPYQTFCGT